MLFNILFSFTSTLIFTYYMDPFQNNPSIRNVIANYHRPPLCEEPNLHGLPSESNLINQTHPYQESEPKPIDTVHPSSEAALPNGELNRGQTSHSAAVGNLPCAPALFVSNSSTLSSKSHETHTAMSSSSSCIGVTCSSEKANGTIQSAEFPRASAHVSEYESQVSGDLPRQMMPSIKQDFGLAVGNLNSSNVVTSDGYQVEASGTKLLEKKYLLTNNPRFCYSNHHSGSHSPLIVTGQFAGQNKESIKNLPRATASRQQSKRDSISNHDLATTIVFSISTLFVYLNGLSSNHSTQTYTHYLLGHIDDTMKAAADGCFSKMSSGMGNVPAQHDLQSLFFSVTVPTLGLDKYVRRFVIYGKYSSFQFGTAFTLMNRIANHRPLLRLSLHNVHRLLTACMCIAITYYDKDGEYDVNNGTVQGEGNISQAWKKRKYSDEMTYNNNFSPNSGTERTNKTRIKRSNQSRKISKTKNVQWKKNECHANNNANPDDDDDDDSAGDGNDSEYAVMKTLCKVSGVHSMSELRRLRSAAVSFLNLENPDKGVSRSEMVSLKSELNIILKQLWNTAQALIASSESTESSSTAITSNGRSSMTTSAEQSVNSTDNGFGYTKNGMSLRYTTPKLVVRVRVSAEEVENEREDNNCIRSVGSKQDSDAVCSESIGVVAHSRSNMLAGQYNQSRKRKLNQESITEDKPQGNYEQRPLKISNKISKSSSDGSP